MPSPGAGEEEFRKWTSTRGDTIEARMLRDNGDGTIRILRRDGWRGNVPLDLFSGEDREYVELLRKATELEEAEAKHSPDFQISRLRRGEVPGYISTPEGWERQIDGLRTEVEYTGSEDSVKGFVKAYFYDDEGQRVAFFAKPPSRQKSSSGNYTDAPEKFHRGLSHEVYFPLSRAVTDGDWRTCIVVFGNKRGVSAVSWPPDEHLVEYDFPERGLLYPDWNKELARVMEGGEEGEAPSEEAGEERAAPGLEFRRLETTEHQRSTRFNNRWQRNKECLAGEIRCNERPPEGKLAIRALFFDDDKKLVKTRATPSMTNTEGSVYIAVPDIAATHQWYPFFFALDGELEHTDWSWAVVVGEADGEAVAELSGPPGAELEDFSFPGKEKVVGAGERE